MTLSFQKVWSKNDTVAASTLFARNARDISLSYLAPSDEGSKLARIVGKMAKHPYTARIGGSRGFSLIEVLVAVTMLGIVAGFGVSRLLVAYGRPTLAHRSAQELVGNLRVARVQAISHNAHYRVVPATSSYQIQRLAFDAGTNSWINPGTDVRTVSLPRPLVFSGATPSVEFDARGLMVQPASTATLNLQDGGVGTARAVQIRLSGQILPPAPGTVY
jgi:prepilin-type N-terminal cleavage/methylation domain-containing protein